MYLTQLCFPHLKKTGGAVVFTSSIMSLSPHAVSFPVFLQYPLWDLLKTPWKFLQFTPLQNMSMPYYAICKAATDHLARSMALEYIKQGVRVNVVK